MLWGRYGGGERRLSWGSRAEGALGRAGRGWYGLEGRWSGPGRAEVQPPSGGGWHGGASLWGGAGC